MYLRDYQETIRDAVLRDLSGPTRTTLYVMPTGCGKTECALDIIDQWPDKDCQVLCLAHRQELIYQPFDRWHRKTGEHASIEMGEYRNTGRSRVCFASKDSLYPDRLRASYPDPKAVGLIWCDEAHHLAKQNKSYSHILDYFMSANPHCRMFGCTATPDRADEKALGEVFQNVAAEYPLLDPDGGPSAIEDGWLVPIQQEVVFVKELEFENVGTRGGDFIDSKLQAMLLENKAVEKIVGATKDIARGLTTLMFTSGIEQAILQAGILNAEQDGCAYAIASRIPEEMNYGYVINSSDNDARRRVLKRWGRGEFPYFSNVGVFTEGMDEPRIRIISMGRPTKSRALYAQMVGRGTRILPGVIERYLEDGSIHRLPDKESRKQAIACSDKAYLTVLDFVGNTQHSLISAVDILGGKYSDEIVERAKRKISSGERDVEKALEEAKQDAILEARKQVRSKIEVERIKLDAFSVLSVSVRREPAWHKGRKPTPGQLSALRNFRIEDAEIAKMSFHQASEILDTLVKRAQTGMCTYRQLKFLQSHGHDAQRLPFDTASAMIDTIMKGRKVPDTLDMVTRIEASRSHHELNQFSREAAKLRCRFTTEDWNRIISAGKKKRMELEPV